jgi:hypothetical protein
VAVTISGPCDSIPQLRDDTELRIAIPRLREAPKLSEHGEQRQTVSASTRHSRDASQEANVSLWS